MIADANADVTQLRCIELHGTGTALGDPTETASLVSALNGTSIKLIAAGGAKASFGHTMAVSGMLGVFKIMHQLFCALVAANAQLRDESDHRIFKATHSVTCPATQVMPMTSLHRALWLA